MDYNYFDDSYMLYIDVYEFLMMQIYYKKGLVNWKVVFEVFFWKMFFENGYVVFVGLEYIIIYLKNFCFLKMDIDYLKMIGQFDDDFLDYLVNFWF